MIRDIAELLPNLERMAGIELSKEIVELMNQNGCNIVGFADISCLPNEARQGFERGILIALPFSKEAMMENNSGCPQRYNDEYAPMNQRFKQLKRLIADLLQEKGYEVVVNTPASVTDKESLRSLLPQKAVATLAGIGWIGKNAMLTTKEAGSALRLTVMLTNAPLECGMPVTKSMCAPNCTVCVDICPGKAPLGALWEAGTDRDLFFNAHACQTAAHERAKSLLGINKALCGLCASNCPYTKAGLGY